jgi:hypothetical protein
MEFMWQGSENKILILSRIQNNFQALTTVNESCMMKLLHA